MRPTSRFTHLGGSAAVLTGLGLLAQSPPTVVGGVILACWLLVSQFTAYEQFRQTADRLTVAFTPMQNAVMVNEEFSVTAEVSLSTPVRAEVTATVAGPAGAELAAESDAEIHLGQGESTDSTTVTWSFPVAGEFEFPPVAIVLRDQRGTVTETITRNPDQTVRVDPREPRNVHVGQGGDRVTAYGEHSAGKATSGVVPAETRQYIAGDALNKIDWKATARMQSPHVREFEGETDRQTVIAIDHSQGMQLGSDGQTMLDYAREVALGFAQAAESVDDPLGLYAIGEYGITTQQLPSSSQRGYQQIRNTLHGLTPTQREDTGAAGKVSSEQLMRPQVARSAARELSGDNSAFARTVTPFLESSEAYVHRVESDPLFSGIERLLAETTGEVWLILLTADTGRNRLRDVASLVGKHGGSLSLFITPEVLFDGGAMDNLNEAYERYASFESFRQTVGGNPRTDVFELGPGDRLDALLAARRRVRQ